MSLRVRATSLENPRTTPELLNVKLSRLLPRLIFIAEEHHLRTRHGLNALERGGLILRAGARRAVAVTRVRPAGFQHVHGFAVADAVEYVDLALNEVTGHVGGDLGVEEGVKVGAYDVDGGAEGAGVAGVLPYGKGFRGGHGSRVARGFEGGGATGDEAGELAGGSVAVEDGLVTHDDKINEIPLCPVDDVRDLALGTADAAGGDPHAEDDLEAVVAGRGADVLERAAVGAVDADGRESLLCDHG